MHSAPAGDSTGNADFAPNFLAHSTDHLRSAFAGIGIARSPNQPATPSSRSREPQRCCPDSISILARRRLVALRRPRAITERATIRARTRDIRLCGRDDRCGSDKCFRQSQLRADGRKTMMSVREFPRANRRKYRLCRRALRSIGITHPWNRQPVAARTTVHELPDYSLATLVQNFGFQIKPPDWPPQWIAILPHPRCLPDFASLNALRKAW
jgi:hypothetical protein